MMAAEVCVMASSSVLLEAPSQQSGLISLKTYLETDYSPDCEWIDGRLKVRNLGEGQHASVQGSLLFLFRSQQILWAIRCFPEQRVQTSEQRFRVPDVCVTRRTAPFEQVIHVPPLLCIEILSKGDLMNEMQEKADDYVQMGVDAVWVINPWTRKAFMTKPDGSLERQAEVLTVPGTIISVSVQEMFAELDELEGRKE